MHFEERSSGLLAPRRGLYYHPAAGGRYAHPQFSPASIANLLTWHKADSLVLNDADPVSSWTDSSGNGWTGSGSGTTRPLYKTNIYNGLPTVRFDGTDDILTTASVPTAVTNNFTQFAVAAQASTAGNAGVCPFFMGNGASNGWGVALDTGTGNAKVAWLRGGIAWLDSTVAESATLRLLVGRRASGTFNLYVNGGASVATTGSAPSAPTTSMRFGSHATGSFKALDACESVIYTAALTDAQINQVGSYLCTRWGLTWTNL